MLVCAMASANGVGNLGPKGDTDGLFQRRACHFNGERHSSCA